MSDRQTIHSRCRAARRLLKRIHRRTVRDRDDDPMASLLPRIEQLRSLMRRWTICRDRDWGVAIESLAQHIQRRLGEIPTIVNRIDQSVRSQNQRGPSFRDMVAELEQLESEFFSMRYCPNAVCATTDPIHLDDVYLGTFEIQLPFAALADPDQEGAYQVIALDPNPPASNDTITHPHVQNNKVCEGEAAAAIQQALIDGRVCDFFILVRGILQTYNPSSPYVSLDDWYGISCGDCGAVVRQDDCFYCTGCDSDRCTDCISYCQSCDDPFCAGCINTCDRCDAPACEGCTRDCPGCGELVCGGCLESCCYSDEEECHEEGSEQPAATAA